MEARDVLDVLAVLAESGVDRVWIDGGWGIDALLGAQYRDHADLDLIVPAEAVPTVIETLGEVAFDLTTDERPARVTLVDPHDRVIDVVPVRFEEDGVAMRSGAAPGGNDLAYPPEELTFGWVAGERVACVGPQVQLAAHCGYEPTDRDREDVERLRERFTLPLPDAYR